MLPRLIGPFHTYGLMLTIGFYAGWMMALRRARKDGVEGKHISDMLVYTVISGIIGARVLYVILEWDSLTSFWEIFEVWRGGLVFYGGLAAGTVTLIIVILRRKLSIAKIADILGPPVALGLMFGRIGCFAYGCCWGDVAEECPIAVRFPGELVAMADGRLVPGEESSPAFTRHFYQYPDRFKDLGPGPARSLPVVPTQPISSADCLLIFLVTSFYFRFRRRYGEVFLLFCLLYSAHRFAIEIFRADNPVFLWGMTISQTLSIVLGIVCLVMLVRSRMLPANVTAAKAPG